jgi:predicted PurR-regulated permease PerM
MTAMAKTLRAWLVAQRVAMVAIGLFSMLVFSLLGVRAALPLGVIAGLFEFIPNVGPTLSAVPAIAMAFVDSPQKALTVTAACWGIQFLENNLLIPYLMKEHLELPPALTLVAQVLMAIFFGLLGLFVAVPLLASVMVALKLLWIEPRDAAAAAAGGGEP